MGVTSRHTRRILAAYRERGAAALAPGHRGRRSVNATPEALVVDVAHLARTRYAGVNHTHLAELLAEREGIHIGRTTLRRVLLDAGLSSPRRRRPPKHRVRRQRMPQEGMLIQMDGSHHPWFGDQAPPFTLLIAVDDATGQVVSAWFCEHEDARSYFLLIRALVEHRGVPVALYTDRHAVFKHTPGPGLPAGPTQFSRAMAELGTQMIFAQSPQAKGRVERTGGTFQDRLVAELRLAGATTLEPARALLDEFVPRFNRRFGVPPPCSEPAFRPLDPELCLEQVRCFKHRSNCLFGQVVGLEVAGFQGVAVLIMALQMVSSLRMHAVRATLGAFPAARSRWSKARIVGLYCVATNVAMYSTDRNCRRPPHTVRFPRMVPLSRL